MGQGECTLGHLTAHPVEHPPLDRSAALRVGLAGCLIPALLGQVGRVRAPRCGKRQQERQGNQNKLVLGVLAGRVLMAVLEALVEVLARMVVPELLPVEAVAAVGLGLVGKRAAQELAEKSL